MLTLLGLGGYRDLDMGLRFMAEVVGLSRGGLPSLELFHLESHEGFF